MIKKKLNLFLNTTLLMLLKKATMFYVPSQEKDIIERPKLLER